MWNTPRARGLDPFARFRALKKNRARHHAGPIWKELPGREQARELLTSYRGTSSTPALVTPPALVDKPQAETPPRGHLEALPGPIRAVARNAAKPTA